MLTKMSRDEKVAVMQQGWEDCLRSHLCGDYLSIGKHEYHWGIIINPRSYFLYIDGVGRMKYDFDFSFDQNLQALYDFGLETLCKKGEYEPEDD